MSKQNWGVQYRLPDCVKSTGIFILLLLHNCPKCNAVFFSSNKTAPIGGHRHRYAGCWFGRSHCPLLTVIRICRVCAKWLIHEMTQMISESTSSNLKHRDFMIDNRRCAKCISNKCRRAARKCQACCSVEENKLIVSTYMVIILSSLTVTFPPDKALAFKIFIRVLTKEMTRKFLLH